MARRKLLVEELNTPCVIERCVSGDRENVWKRVDKTFASIRPAGRGGLGNEDGQTVSAARFSGKVRAGTRIQAEDRLNGGSHGIYFVEAVRRDDVDPSVLLLDLVERTDGSEADRS